MPHENQTKKSAPARDTFTQMPEPQFATDARRSGRLRWNIQKAAEHVRQCACRCDDVVRTVCPRCRAAIELNAALELLGIPTAN